MLIENVGIFGTRSHIGSLMVEHPYSPVNVRSIGMLNAISKHEFSIFPILDLDSRCILPSRHQRNFHSPVLSLVVWTWFFQNFHLLHERHFLRVHEIVHKFVSCDSLVLSIYIQDIIWRVSLLPLPHIDLNSVFKVLLVGFELPLGLVFSLKLLKALILWFQVVVLVQNGICRIDLNFCGSLFVFDGLLHFEHLFFEPIEVYEREKCVHSIHIDLLVMLLFVCKRSVKLVDLFILEVELPNELWLDGLLHDLQIIVVHCLIDVLVLIVIVKVLVVLFDESSLRLLEIICRDQFCDRHKYCLVFLLILLHWKFN